MAGPKSVLLRAQTVTARFNRARRLAPREVPPLTFFILQALWLFLPAYMANMAPVFAMKLLPRWNARMDGGRTWKDGRPMLGAGKTWRGLAAGTLVGALTALAQSTIRATDVDFSDMAYSWSGGAWGPTVVGLALGAGAILGDATKSFFKRRTGREGGAPWIPFDQLDFVAGGLLVLGLAFLALEPLAAQSGNWFWQEFGGTNWPRLLVILLATPLLHFLVNVIGYKLGMKKVPW